MVAPTRRGGFDGDEVQEADALRILRHGFTAALLFIMAGAMPASAGIVWGVNGHPITSYPGVSYAEQLDLLKDLGAHSYRVDVSDLAAADRLEALLKEAKARDITILPVLTPRVDLKTASESELYNLSRDLAEGLGLRFKTDIRVWELGNEMENFAIIQPCETRDDGTVYPCEWGPAGGLAALDYYGPRWAKVSAVLRGLTDGMNRADPTIRKAMGTAGWGHLGAYERMRADGIEWDISVWHMYGEDPEEAFKQLASYGVPIWVTEINHPKGSQDGARKQADGLIRWMKRLEELAALYPVEQAHIYELLDETYWAPDFEAYMGLVELHGSTQDGWKTGGPKPAYAAVRQFLRDPHAAPRPSCDIAEIKAIADAGLRRATLGYCLILGRSANADEARGWAQSLNDGTANTADMLTGMLASAEFQQKYATAGMDDRSYVELLYQLLLNRPADGGGLDSYLVQLSDKTATRETVARALVQSDEFTGKHDFQ